MKGRRAAGLGTRGGGGCFPAIFRRALFLVGAAYAKIGAHGAPAPVLGEELVALAAGPPAGWHSGQLLTQPLKMGK